MWRCRMSVALGDGVAVKCIERFFPICMFRGLARTAPVDEFSTDTGAMMMNVWTVSIPAGDYPSRVLHFLGTNSFWRPRDARLMFGAAFTSYKPTSLAKSNTDVASLAWLAGDVLMLPTIICFASTTKPSTTARWATCNGVMLAAGLLLLGYAIALAYARPYRIGARNAISPLVVVWMATTCLLASPLVTDHMTATSADTARGAVSLLQSITVLLLAASEVIVFFTIDRTMALRELQEIVDHDEASDDALVEEQPIVDREERSALCAPQEGCTSFPDSVVLVDMPLFQPLLIEHDDETLMSSWWRQQAGASDYSNDVDAAASSLLLFPILGLDDDNISPQRKPLKTDLEVLYGSFRK
ncbi:membrane-associated protein, putative [Bodo saltans]|uniref:Membrane-associated protein, putative n=1 Tax=Bodo saltans TaxID=75058 RepID=A0A0S4JJL5_BODSA|nr:membrane-associated protein, putative [Bodo saltans]|eukprot:CUG90400.1 membrane-associated protein, putative [Bodo saltans]